MKITSLDHLVLTVADRASSISFYHDVLGMDIVHFGDDRVALAFGDQKINLHVQGHEITPYAARPTPGSADLCLLTDQPVEQVIKELQSAGIAIEVGPVPRTGATGPIMSVYVRDPDGNLIEIANQA